MILDSGFSMNRDLFSYSLVSRITSRHMDRGSGGGGGFSIFPSFLFTAVGTWPLYIEKGVIVGLGGGEAAAKGGGISPSEREREREKERERELAIYISGWRREA